MRAWILKAAGRPLQLDQLETLNPGPGEAVVDLHAAALNRRDVWMQRGNYFGNAFPAVLGSDGAGVVSAVGSGVDPSWLGAAVIVNPGLAWGGNEACAGKGFRTLGGADNGTFAEQLRIDAAQLHRMPAHLDFIHAAALPLAGLTGYRAMITKGQLKAGESVLITGAGGGVAQIMIQMALATGARVYATSGSVDKTARLSAMGIAGAANYRDTDWPEVLRTLAPGGFDLIVDSACGPDFGQLLSLAAPGGRLVYFGITAGAAPPIDMRAFYLKQLSLTGTLMGSPVDFAAMVRLVEAHAIVPVVDSVQPFEDINPAFERLYSGAQFGKIVLEIRRPA
ncbi:MAG: zinc-binding dehydrogenase [Burkholderiaceae bacterium]|nr:zinc-binding dehydrogenase [Burkholderiaceae bacterium]